MEARSSGQAPKLPRGRRARHVCKGVIQELGRSCHLRGRRYVRREAITEARADGRQEVGVLRSTEEAGEPAPRGPGGGKGAPLSED
jgi:hypothetical protein